MTTIDQADRLILDFYRCAMLPLSPGAGLNDAEHADDLSKVGADLGPPPSAVDDWDGDVFRERIPGPHSMPAWRARCCTAVPMWSAVHRSWLVDAEYRCRSP